MIEDVIEVNNNDEKDIPTEKVEENLSDSEESPEDIDQSDKESKETSEEQEPDDITVTIGDEKSEEDQEQEEVSRDPSGLVNKLRKNIRDLKKQNFKLKKQHRESQDTAGSVSSQNKTVEAPGKKPTLEDYDYDTEQFENGLSSWFEKKRAADEQLAKEKDKEKQIELSWQEKLNRYEQSKQSLKVKVKDFEEAEYLAEELLSTTQRGILISAFKDPALIKYALFKNQKKMEEISKIDDPIDFAIAIKEVEVQLKVNTIKKPPAPEKVLAGNSGTASSVNSTLERLRDEASRTGDYTKLHMYKRKLKSSKEK